MLKGLSRKLGALLTALLITASVVLTGAAPAEALQRNGRATGYCFDGLGAAVAAIELTGNHANQWAYVRPYFQSTSTRLFYSPADWSYVQMNAYGKRTFSETITGLPHGSYWLVFYVYWYDAAVGAWDPYETYVASNLTYVNGVQQYGSFTTCAV